VRYYGPIHEDGYVTKRGYVMSQYARFIRPGFLKVDATANPYTGVYVTAYKNASRIVIVAVNMSSSSIFQTFKIQNGTVTTFTPYVTSSTKNCAQAGNIGVSGDSLAATLNPSSVTTFVSD
jgi:glucuronoarabinoxylan endo-1,4-beta-xylanase